MSEIPSDRQIDRRQWLVQWGRNSMLGTIAAASGLLLWRGRHRVCSSPALACRQCIERQRCQLPRARKSRIASGPKERNT